MLPAYLFLCLILGGSSRAAWGSVALQAIAPWLISYAALADRSVEQTRSSRLLLWLLGAWLLLVFLQLLPIPPGLWTQLPGREDSAEGFRELDYALPWLPFAMAPYDLLRALVTLLPPAAALLMVLRLRQNEGAMAGAIVIAAMAGVTLGALQIGGGGPGQSPWYPYAITNVGAVGFFANSNHMGSLLLASFPFAMALIARRSSGSRSNFATSSAALGAAGCLMIAIGVALNRSLAALGLFIPVAFASILLLQQGSRHKRLIVPATAVAAVVCLAVLTGSGLRAELAGSDTSSFVTRADMWRNTLRLIAKTFPFGTGVGSFPSIYALGEDPRTVGLTYINHAHNGFSRLFWKRGCRPAFADRFAGLVAADVGGRVALAFFKRVQPRGDHRSGGADPAQHRRLSAAHGGLVVRLRSLPWDDGDRAFAIDRRWSRFRAARHVKIA